MRLLLIITSVFFLVGNTILGISAISNLKADKQANSTKDNSKIITITIAIKERIPIREELKLLDKYYFKLLSKNISLISLINSLDISNNYFDILAMDLNVKIADNYTLILIPKVNAIKYYSRTSINSEVLMNIGLEGTVAKKITTLFHDYELSSELLLEKLKICLPTVNRKYILIMRKFIVF